MTAENIVNAAHVFCAALHSERIDPAKIEILLPHEQWWRLWTRLESEYRGVMKFDGRGYPPGEFHWMGIKFKPLTKDS